MTESNSATVLIVDDDENVTQLFRRWLEDDYTVEVATVGDEALRILDEKDVDVVLLDRRMPGLSGDDVLRAINERGIDCEVAMVTAVEPDLDIIKMGFDDYLVKPPTRDDLRSIVSNLLERREYSERRQEYWSLISKQAALKTEKSESELEESEEYGELQARIEALSDELEQAQERMSEDAEFLSTIRNIDSGSTPQ